MPRTTIFQFLWDVFHPDLSDAFVFSSRHRCATMPVICIGPNLNVAADANEKQATRVRKIDDGDQWYMSTYVSYLK